jgi:hypothetical protein
MPSRQLQAIAASFGQRESKHTFMVAGTEKHRKAKAGATLVERTRRETMENMVIE